MKNNKIHTPDGVKDFLPVEFIFKNSIERKIESIFYSYGFLPVSSPTIEFLEVFEGKGSVLPSQIYKILDRDGAMLALRSDMTPAIARIAATEYSKEDLPFRFSYITNTFRYNESYQGKSKEITQAGIELIGINSDESTAEVIAIAIKSLIAAGLEDFRVDIGSVRFFKAIIDDLALDEVQREKLQGFLINKDFVSVENMINECNISNEIKMLFKELPLLIGGKEIIEKARAYAKSAEASAALDQIENIFNILSLYGLEKYVLFDLSMIGHLDYYTGIIFRAYSYGAATSIIDGGRYDMLLSKFGSDYPAVGFAIKINVLLSVLINEHDSKSLYEDVTLITYTENGMNNAFAIADKFRDAGLRIENSLLGTDLDKNIAYATRKGIGGILYFMDDDNVKVIDLKDNSSQIVNINDL